MTLDEQDALVGRTLRQYKETASTLAKLMVKSREIADVAQKLANSLMANPDRIVVATHESGMIAGASFVYTLAAQQSLSPDSLHKHLAEIKILKQQKEVLGNQLIQLGQDIPRE